MAAAAVWCNMRPLTGQSSQSIVDIERTPPATTTTTTATTSLSVRNHQCPFVCCRPQLTTSALSTQAWTARARNVHGGVLPSSTEWSEVKLGLTYTPTGRGLETSPRDQSSVKLRIYLVDLSLAYISSVLVRPFTLAAWSRSVEAVNILLLSLCRLVPIEQGFHFSLWNVFGITCSFDFVRVLCWKVFLYLNGLHTDFVKVQSVKSLYG